MPLISWTVEKKRKCDNLRLSLRLIFYREGNLDRRFHIALIIEAKTRLFFPICFVSVASSRKNVRQSSPPRAFSCLINHV